MFCRKEIIIAMILFTAPLAAFDVNEASAEISKKFNKKHEITEENFNMAMKSVSERPGGEYLGEKLKLKLRKFIWKKLSANEWYSEFTKAYNEILREVGPLAFTIKMAHPIEELAIGIIWAIPNE